MEHRVEKRPFRPRAAPITEMTTYREDIKDIPEPEEGSPEFGRPLHEFIQEPDKNLAVHNEIIQDLQYRLGHVAFSLANARNQQHFLRKQFNVMKGLLAAELGEGIQVHLLLVPGNAERWKGRAQQIRNLEAKVTSLENELDSGLSTFEYDPRKTVNPDEIYVAKRQREVLNKIYDERKELSEKSEYEVDEFMNDFQNMSLMYKSSIARNKLLAEELKNLKEHIQVTRDKSTEDSVLVSTLLNHITQMRDIIEKEKVICDKIYKEREEELLGIQPSYVDHTSSSYSPGAVLSDGTLRSKIREECEKYRAMWEETQGEKKDLEELVASLNKKLDDVTNQVIEAERYCIEQHCEIKEVREQLTAIKDHGKALPRRGETPDKNARYRLLEEKLKALRDENQYLRSFMNKAIMTKEDDFQIYQASMEAVKRKYFRSLNTMKRT